MCLKSLCRFLQVKRLDVPDDKVDWLVTWQEYDPPEYTSPSLKGQEWADGDLEFVCLYSTFVMRFHNGLFLTRSDPDFHPKFNEMDSGLNRKSHVGLYEIVEGCPRYQKYFHFTKRTENYINCCACSAETLEEGQV